MRRSILLLALLICPAPVFGDPPATAPATAPTAPPQIHLDITTHNVSRLELRLNGMPLSFPADSGASRSESYFANIWAKEGLNEITFTWKVKPEAKNPRPEVEVAIQIRQVMPAAGGGGGGGGGQKVLARLRERFLPADLPRQPERSTSLAFFIDSFPIKMLPWMQKGRKLQPADEAHLRQAVMELVEAYRARDAERVEATYADKEARYALSTGMSPRMIQLMQKGMLNGMFKDPAYAVQPLEAGRITFKQEGDRNLYEAVVEGETSPLRIKRTHSAFAPRLFFCRQAGQWRLVN